MARPSVDKNKHAFDLLKLIEIKALHRVRQANQLLLGALMVFADVAAR